MFKNKYVFWGIVAVWVVVLIGGASWFVLSHGDTHQAASLSQSTSSVPADAGTKSQTITAPPASTGPQIAGGTNAGTSLSGGSSNSSTSELAKLLDPTTFTQYDKYRNAQSASYVDLQTGTGTAIAVGSQVAVVYKGWLTNGTLFDESKAGSDGKIQAFSFTVGQHQVISGWETGLVGAKDGGVRLLIIPPAVGYGPAGQGPIPGNSVLIFQVQIVQVK